MHRTTRVEWRPLVRRQLLQEVPGSDDRSRHQLREEGDEKGEVSKIAGRAKCPPVDVERVGHRLERVEADADREDDPERSRRHGHAEVGHQVHELGDEEVGVLEDAEHAQVRGQADDQEGLAPPRVRRGVDGDPRSVVDECRDPDQRQEAPIPPGVEDVAGNEHGGLPGPGPLQEHRMGGQDERQEDGEGDRRK